MKTREELVMIAFRMYGECIGSAMCKNEVQRRLVSEYGLAEEEALEITELAFEEWMDAYQ